MVLHHIVRSATLLPRYLVLIRFQHIRANAIAGANRRIGQLE